MNTYIGIDLGTSAVKVLLIGEDGILGQAEASYDVYSPAPSYSEQNPRDWYEKTLSALGELLAKHDAKGVRAIGFSGQMHGLVMLDAEDNVLRPAILWNDGRSGKEVAYLNNTVGKDFLLSHTGNIAFAGFTAPKLLWVKENEPEHFAKAAKIMLPKDYLAYRLSGVLATDTSDASGTLYFDVEKRAWSKEMLDLIGITEAQLPTVHESSTAIGNIRAELAEALGLSPDTKIVIGAGDNAAAAVGCGVVYDGACNISLGTSGTIFVASNEYAYHKDSAIHAFDSASGTYHYLACILSAASAQKWWIEDILDTDYDMTGLKEYVGKNRVYFLPYLSGERSPVNDENAKALFLGMTPHTTRAEMTLAVLEGVAYALRQNLDLIRANGVTVTRSKICGGGAKNRLWLEMIASILGVELELPENEQGGALGAALLAAGGVMTEDEYNDFSTRFYKIRETVAPDAALSAAYEDRYQTYLKLYPAVRGLMK